MSVKRKVPHPSLTQSSTDCGFGAKLWLAADKLRPSALIDVIAA